MSGAPEGGEVLLRPLSGRFTTGPVYACDLGEPVEATRIQACVTVRTPAATSFFYYAELGAAQAAYARLTAPSGGTHR